MKKFVSLLMVIAMALALMTPAMAEETVTLQVFNIVTPEDPTYEALMETFDRFCEANPNVEIEFEGITQIEYQAKLNAMIAADNIPDVFYTRDDWNYDLVQQGKLYCMDGLLEANPEWRDLFLDIWKEQKVDEKIYGIPYQFITNEAVYYNSTIAAELGYEALPETWEDFVTFLQACKDAGYIPMVLGARDGWPVWSHLGEPLTQYMCGNEWVEKIGAFDPTYTYENPEFISVLQMIADLKNNGYINEDVVSTDSAEVAQYYYTGEAVCLLSGSWTAGGLQVDAPDDIFAATVAAPLPRPVNAAEEVQHGIFTGGSGWAWAISANIDEAKLPYAEALIMECVSNASALVDLTNGRMPAMSLDKLEGVDGIEMSHLLKSFLSHVAQAPAIFQMNRQQNGNTMCNAIYKACQELLSGMITAEEAAAVIQKTYLEVAATR